MNYGRHPPMPDDIRNNKQDDSPVGFQISEISGVGPSLDDKNSKTQRRRKR